MAVSCLSFTLCIALNLLLFFAPPTSALTRSAPHTEVINGLPIRGPRGARALRKTLQCQARHGEWVRNPKPRRLPWVRQIYGINNLCDREYRDHYRRGPTPRYISGVTADKLAESGGNWSVAPEAVWEYRVHRCPWHPFSYEKFCKTMHAASGMNASILIVGGDHAWGLERRLFYNLVAAGPRPPTVVNLFPVYCSSWNKILHPKFCSGYRFCYDVLDGDSVAIRFVRNTRLTLPIAEDGINGPWLQVMRKNKATIVVLNHDEPGVSLEEFEFRLRGAVDEIRKSFDGIRLVVYMATPVVPNCALLATAEWEGPYDKDLYAAQNKIAEKVMLETQGLFLDLSTPLTLRPPEMLDDFSEFQQDSKECINECRVGHADTFATQFFHAVIMAYKSIVPQDEFRPKKQRVVEEPLDEMEDLITVDHLVVKPPDKAPILRGYIPGSTITTKKTKLQVERRIACRTEGEWVYNPKPRFLPWPKTPLTYQSAPCDGEFVQAGKGIAGEEADRAVVEGTQWTVRGSLKWEWKPPERCPLEKFTHESFCRLLGPKRSIFVLGDSLNVGIHRHFHSNIQMGVDSDADPTVDLFESQPLRAWDIGLRFDICNGYSICHDVWGADQGVEFRFCFNSRLTLSTVPLNDQAPWALVLAEWRPSIIIVNSGAHYRPDDEFETEVRAALWFIRETLPDALIIWRNTPPGHANCTDYDGPIKQRQSPIGLPFHWGDFAPQNEIAKALVKEVGGVYIDVDILSALRPDGHFENSTGTSRIDCLHWCQPGPLDTWIHLIYMALKDLLEE
eukprot:TRINITY_DN4801_c0_g1_i1.p1 TRINITY_DN4801_c0_g1~~TRINITY_DN4801_c0_g1_i1.p1  ORF type:complete len:790 (+),score=66.25 TRINITY_DN4801_c0_g1_i1:208-2577(+)